MTITRTLLDIIYRPIFYLEHDVSETNQLCPETEPLFYWAHLSRIHLQMETDFSLRNVVT
jgi:hypothetical protein